MWNRTLFFFFSKSNWKTTNSICCRFWKKNGRTSRLPCSKCERTFPRILASISQLCTAAAFTVISLQYPSEQARRRQHFRQRNCESQYLRSKWRKLIQREARSGSKVFSLRPIFSSFAAAPPDNGGLVAVVTCVKPRSLRHLEYIYIYIHTFKAAQEANTTKKGKKIRSTARAQQQWKKKSWNFSFSSTYYIFA